MAWKTTTKIYSRASAIGTDGSAVGNLAKDVNDFLTDNDGSTLANSFPNISISSIGDEVLVIMSIENG